MANKNSNTGNIILGFVIGFGTAYVIGASMVKGASMVSGVSKNPIKKILNENDKVLNFIKTWQSENLYNSSKLNEYNAKFRNDLNNFLDNGNFSKQTIQLFRYN